jgi:energy-coupling factor transport system ATP-binding protein
MAEQSPVALGKIAAYLPQRSAAVLFNESIRAEIDFTIRQRDRDSARDGLIDSLALSDILDRDPRDLSEGQRLRAALAAVLVGDPRVVLLDEPTRGLDGVQKQQLARVIRTMRDRGACIVIATHDVELAAMLADRVVLLGHGQVIADGPPREVLSGSMAFSTQINRLFGPGYLTLADIDVEDSNACEDSLHVEVS